MIKIFMERLTLVIILILLAISMYFIHYVIFNNVKDTVSNIILSLAYVPIGVIYNILIINKILEARERIKVGKKINIIIGMFFNELGTDLIKAIIPGDVTIEEIRVCSLITRNWKEENFTLLKKTIEDYECILKIENIDLKKLNSVIDQNHRLLLNLIANPILEEYSEFTEMLIAIYQLNEEIKSRFCDFILKEYEKKQLIKGICKLYMAILDQWVDYITHLNLYYPALFVKALINSPFDDRSKEDKDKEFLQLSEGDMK